VALPALFRLQRPAAKDTKDAKAGGKAKGGGKADMSGASGAGKGVMGGAGRDGCPGKTALARELVGLLVAALPGRRVSVSADAACRGKPPRQMPPDVRFMSRLPANAGLAGPAPPRVGERGRPRLRGPTLGKPADLAAALEWRSTTVARRGEQVTVEAAPVAGQ
jgi:hypothetical protein